MAGIPGLVKPLVEAPPVAALRYGVFAAARVTEITDPEQQARLWGSGYSYITDHCGGAVAYDDTCAAQPAKTFVEGSDLIEGDPFRVMATKQCGSVGRTAAEMEQAVRQQLASGEQSVVEAVMWDGSTLATHTPTLTGSGATALVPAAPGAGAAIAELEESGYDVFGYQGVIHVNTAAYAALAYSNLVVRDGAVLRTPLGTRLSFGSGYGTTGPDDLAAPAGFVWAFMTSMVDIRRTPVFVPPMNEVFDRTGNQWMAEAIRAYAFTWDCPEVFAVLVPVAAPAVASAPAVPGP